jgi:hypothetical protein
MDTKERETGDGFSTADEPTVARGPGYQNIALICFDMLAGNDRFSHPELRLS